MCVHPLLNSPPTQFVGATPLYSLHYSPLLSSTSTHRQNREEKSSRESRKKTLLHVRSSFVHNARTRTHTHTHTIPFSSPPLPSPLLAFLLLFPTQSQRGEERRGEERRGEREKPLLPAVVHSTEIERKEGGRRSLLREGVSPSPSTESVQRTNERLRALLEEEENGQSLLEYGGEGTRKKEGTRLVSLTAESHERTREGKNRHKTAAIIHALKKIQLLPTFVKNQWSTTVLYSRKGTLMQKERKNLVAKSE